MKIPVAVVSIQRVVLICKIRDVDRRLACVQIVADGDPHGSLFGSVLAYSCSGLKSELRKFSVSLILV